MVWASGSGRALSLSEFELFLQEPEYGRRWLAQLGVRDPDRGVRDLRDLAKHAGSNESAASLMGQAAGFLAKCPDAGMALTNLDRFLAACPDPQGTSSAVALDPRTAEILIQLLSTSQLFSELLIRDTSLLSWLRSTPGRRSRDDLASDLWEQLRGRPVEQRRDALAGFRLRELLRIGYSDIVRDVPLDVTTADLSHLADACIEAAYRSARENAETRHGWPVAENGEPLRFVVLALGKLGGEELNYSSDIDLVFLYDVEGRSTGERPMGAAEYFARLGSDLIRTLTEPTGLGPAYRVDMRLRPEGDQGPLARSLTATLGYYETRGRTWERQALIKCRPVAGDFELGRDFLKAISPFVYRRYLGGTEIGEIKAMKRRIENRTQQAGVSETEVKTGHGGIRDVEFVVQFLQLLHGGTYPSVRHPNTLAAMHRLEQIGCLDAEERASMEETYRFLRRIEHRLQTMFGQQTHQMPERPDELRALAIRMGFPPLNPWEDRQGPAQRFLSTYRFSTERNRRILNHLLHDAFRDDSGADVEPVVDLVLDPDPTREAIARAFERYPFRDRARAYENLMALASEDSEFLSDARCRHFLAAIAPRLLQAVSRTPDPDMALTNLEKVSASLGAKAILWELFSLNPPTLRLYVEVCATSQFLSEILTTNPGMIDDLMDSLVVDRPQTGRQIRGELEELCHGAEDLAPILMGFRNKEWVRIGVRDILGREPTRIVLRELSDVAQAIVATVASDQYEKRAEKLGRPRISPSGEEAGWAILAFGKLGGRELSYNSDLDLVMVYEADGETTGGEKQVSNEQFFGDWFRRVLRALEGADGMPGLYRIDTRLRPYGASGRLVMTLDSFAEYHDRHASGWEKLALTRGRVLCASPRYGRVVSRTLRTLMSGPVDASALAVQVTQMRRKLEESASASDLKRGVGGQFDVEFTIQYLQRRYGPSCPSILVPNTWEALRRLAAEGYIEAGARDDLAGAYAFQKSLESRIRIVHNRAASELPNDEEELCHLVSRLGYNEVKRDEPPVQSFLADLQMHARRARHWFLELVARAAGA